MLRTPCALGWGKIGERPDPGAGGLVLRPEASSSIKPVQLASRSAVHRELSLKPLMLLVPWGAPGSWCWRSCSASRRQLRSQSTSTSAHCPTTCPTCPTCLLGLPIATLPAVAAQTADSGCALERHRHQSAQKPLSEALSIHSQKGPRHVEQDSLRQGTACPGPLDTQTAPTQTTARHNTKVPPLSVHRTLCLLGTQLIRLTMLRPMENPEASFLIRLVVTLLLPLPSFAPTMSTAMCLRCGSAATVPTQPDPELKP